MGCSPSKGSTFGTLGSMKRGRLLPPAPQENPRTSKLDEEEKCNSKGSTDGNTMKGKVVGQTSVTELGPEVVNVNKLESQELVKTTVTQRKEKNVEKQDGTDKRSARKVKKNTRGTKVLKKKDKDKPTAEVKVDFPEPLVKAHQAAYVFLNPSINKYGVLLGLLEEATQTQVSVQPMIAFMTLRYEEIIQGMDAIASEGEKVLKENGEHLAWPSQMRNLSSSSPLKCGSDNIEPPPDLLQQLLQYTTQRMQNVCQTVSGIGDSALEDAVEYFASVSELLEEKLKVKRAVETRLMQLLSRIEMASLRKPGPEDSALFSEDSGIGAENESLAGSETSRRRQSCESTGTNRATPVTPLAYRTMNIRKGASSKKIISEISPSVSLTSLNSLDSTCTIMANDQRDSVLGSVSLDDGEEDNNEDDEELDRGMGDVKVRFRQRSNSSPVNHEQKHPCRLPPKRIENPQNVEMTLKMKNAISGRIQFVPSQNSSTKAKVQCSPKTKRRQWTEEEEQSQRRPQTATTIQKSVVKKTVVAKERRTQSAESLRTKGEDPTLLELERTQKDLNQRLQRMSKDKQGSTRTSIAKQKITSPAQSPAITRKHLLREKKNDPQPLKDKACHTCNNKKQEGESNVEENKQKDNKTPKGPVKATPPPSPPSSPRPSSGFYRGRNSVKKLIDTFSQGIEELDGPKVLGPLKGVRKCGVPVLPGLGNVEAVLSTGISSCRPESMSCEKNEYLDLDSLPPPPLEVLMDNSFEGAQCPSAGTADDGTKVGKPLVFKRAAVSQRLRNSVQSVTVLPSKGGLPQASALSRVNKPDVPTQTPEDPGKEKDLVYHQARKVIHPKHASDSELEILSTTNESEEIQGGGILSVSGPSTIQSIVPPSSGVTNQPPVTPLMSRGRMLPSTPSTPSSLHRSLPSPESCKRQPTPPSSNSTSFNRTLPTPPTVQRRLPSPPTAKQNLSDSKPVPMYPFKAPSPPASPKVQRWSRENSSEDSTSARTMSNARSVFCPSSPSLFEAQPCSVPHPPQAWTSSRVSFLSRAFGNRGRVPLPIQGPRPFIRRSHSDRRPSVSHPQKSPGTSVAETCGSEPVICSKGLDDDPTRGEELLDSQSDLRAAQRSASHPDLCVVGHALYRD